MTAIYSVILAAGVSKRLGFNKLTVKIDSETVIRRSVAPFLEAALGEVIVVTASDTSPVAGALKGLDVRIVPNEGHLRGMSTSVRAALPFIKDGEAVFFHLGDKPFVKRELLSAMLDRYRETGAKIIIPVHDGMKGHPVLMSVAPYRADMEGLEGDKGLREVIEKYSADVLFIKGDEGTLFDIDTPQDIEILKQRGYKVEKGE